MAIITLLIAFYIQEETIAKVECVNKDVKNSTCHGKCYLAKEMKAIAPPASSNPEIKQLEVPYYFENYIQFQLEGLGYVNTLHFKYMIEFGVNNPSLIFHPPPISALIS